MDPKDHDILIEIKTQVTRLISDVKDLKDDTARRVEKVEQDKMSRKEFEEAQLDHEKAHKLHDSQLAKHEKRIDFLISAYWKAIGALAALELIARFIPQITRLFL